MRIRHALATTAVGTAVALGVSVAPAFAVSSAATTAAAAGTAHYWATYNTFADCTAAGVRVVQSNPDRYYHAECTPSGTQWKLWVWF